MEIGYHASHEQHSPRALLEFAQLAEQAGFDRGMCSDHIAPWLERQGHSGFSFAWLGAALQATSLSFGVVAAPGYRYHPVVLAHAIGTLGEMFPGRFWLAAGSGELLNEHTVGVRWPGRPERMARLLESVQVMRRLLAGETVDHRGSFTVEDGRLYVRPLLPVPIFAAAISRETARWAGSWADGIVTVAGSVPAMRDVVCAFRDGGGEGKPVYVQAQHSIARTDEEAEAAAHQQWPISGLGGDVLADLRTPGEFAAATRTVRREDVLQSIRVAADPAKHIAWIDQYRQAGFDAAFIHNVQRDDRMFIERFGEEVLPKVR